MFRLTLRAHKSPPQPPSPMQDVVADGPSDAERRLAKELSEVLAKRPTPHRRRADNELPVTAPPAATERRQFHDVEHAGPSKTVRNTANGVADLSEDTTDEFRWHEAELDEDAEFGAHGQSSTRWLSRAQRQRRLAQFRSFAQWTVVVAACLSLLIVTFWPNAI